MVHTLASRWQRSKATCTVGRVLLCQHTLALPSLLDAMLRSSPRPVPRNRSQVCRVVWQGRKKKLVSKRQRQCRAAFPCRRRSSTCPSPPITLLCMRLRTPSLSCPSSPTSTRASMATLPRIEAIALVGSKNQRLLLSSRAQHQAATEAQRGGDETLRLEYAAHCALDIVEERSECAQLAWDMASADGRTRQCNHGEERRMPPRHPILALSSPWRTWPSTPW